VRGPTQKDGIHFSALTDASELEVCNDQRWRGQYQRTSKAGLRERETWRILVADTATNWHQLVATRFPPGWGWLVIPIIPTMPITIGVLVTLAAVVIGAYAGVAWLRNNI